jgi:diguanylate cyclase (GGDEF)-like protein
MRFEIAGLCFTDMDGLVVSHDLGLVALSYLVAVFGSFVSLEMIERWRRAKTSWALCWEVASAATLGGSIWSMHFIAMLALRTSFEVTYAPGLTLLSLLIPIIAVGWGLHALRSSNSLVRIACAGVAVGIGVAAMHYIGMASMRFPGALAYRPGLWTLSILVGVSAATAALWLSLNLRSGLHRALAAFVMGAAICGMHFTGMLATVFTYDPLQQAETGLNGSILAVMVAAITMALALYALIFVSADRRLMANGERDADSLRRKNVELEQSQAKFDVAIGNMSQGLTFFDRDERMVVCNNRFGEIYGLPAHLMLAGATLTQIFEWRKATGFFPAMEVAEYMTRRDALVAHGKPFDLTDDLANGSTINIHYEPLISGGWVITHDDVTERRKAEADVQFMARHDMLTRLPNRVAFHERLEQAIAMTGRGEQCAIHCLDLDNFKIINDTLGHPIGDLLLQAASERLQSCVREIDTVARLGGDEFAIIQRGTKSAHDAVLLANRIIEAFKKPFDLGDHHAPVGVSIGVAMAPDDGNMAEALLKSADIALYLSKAEGRGKARFFESEMNARVEKRRILELDLRGALHRNEFELFYQPLVTLETGVLAQFEALLRWNHPTRGMVSPADFIPVAEETGLIVDIGAWVLQAACKEAASWPNDVRIAVNLSPVQFKDGGLVRTVREALATSGLDPRRLELEITESVLLQDSATTLDALHEIRALAVTIALDDFGTGYSSLSYLRRFPFDKMKIDQSFVREMGESEDAMAIIRAIAGLGQSLRMTTTAEGVETIEQLERLRAEGCTQAQGYYLSRPQPVSALPELFEKFAKTVVPG